MRIISRSTIYQKRANRAKSTLIFKMKHPVFSLVVFTWKWQAMVCVKATVPYLNKWIHVLHIQLRGEIYSPLCAFWWQISSSTLPQAFIYTVRTFSYHKIQLTTVNIHYPLDKQQLNTGSMESFSNYPAST